MNNKYQHTVQYHIIYVDKQLHSKYYGDSYQELYTGVYRKYQHTLITYCSLHVINMSRPVHILSRYNPRYLQWSTCSSLLLVTLITQLSLVDLLNIVKQDLSRLRVNLLAVNQICNISQHQVSTVRNITNVRTLDKQVGIICEQFYILSRDSFINIIVYGAIEIRLLLLLLLCI